MSPTADSIWVLVLVGKPPEVNVSSVIKPRMTKTVVNPFKLM